jgi:hypothetical protein
VLIYIRDCLDPRSFSDRELSIFEHDRKVITFISTLYSTCMYATARIHVYISKVAGRLAKVEGASASCRLASRNLVHIRRLVQNAVLW